MGKAIEAAAERAKLKRYGVVEIRSRIEGAAQLQTEFSNYTSGVWAA